MKANRMKLFRIIVCGVFIANISDVTACEVKPSLYHYEWRGQTIVCKSSAYLKDNDPGYELACGGSRFNSLNGGTPLYSTAALNCLESNVIGKIEIKVETRIKGLEKKLLEALSEDQNHN